MAKSTDQRISKYFKVAFSDTYLIKRKAIGIVA